MNHEFIPEIVLIGGGVVDIPLRPVDKCVFDAGSYPLDSIRMRVGGDAVNESIIASRLGRRVMLVSKVGRDGAGRFICDTLEESGVNTDFVVREEHLDTGINIVLIREDGERSFITNRNGSLRKLALSDVMPALQDPRFARAKIACLASIFVSPALSAQDTAALFAQIKAKGLILCADTTRPKNGEHTDDIAELLSHLDYFFPNYEEAERISGKHDLDEIADDFLRCGLKNIVIKIGSRGVFLKNDRFRAIVPAYPETRCVDTTGAGDNFAAGFLTALLDGRDFVECARYANAVASVCVESVGATVGVTDRKKVDARYQQMRDMPIQMD